MTTSSESGQSELLGTQTPLIVSLREWKAASERLLVKEKACFEATKKVQTL